MVVRFDLERTGPAIANIDDARVLARSLQHEFTAGGQSLQVHARRFIGAVLAPHHAEDAEFGERGLAPAEQLLDLFVLVGSKAVLPDGLRRECRSQGSKHGGASIVAFWSRRR